MSFTPVYNNHMKIKIHDSWNENVTTFVKLVNEKNFQLIKLAEEQQRITFSILLQTSPSINAKIDEIVRSKIPEPIKNKLFIQPNQGYHITLQWTDLPEVNKQNQIADEIIHMHSNLKALRTTITGPYVSAKNLFFTVNTETNIPDIRKDIDNKLKSYDLVTKLPLAFNLLWISTCRFIELPNESEKEWLFKDMEQECLKDVMFDNFIVSKNDPFLSNEGQILKRIRLTS